MIYYFFLVGFSYSNYYDKYKKCKNNTKNVHFFVKFKLDLDYIIFDRVKTFVLFHYKRLIFSKNDKSKIIDFLEKKRIENEEKERRIEKQKRYIKEEQERIRKKGKTR